MPLAYKGKKLITFDSNFSKRREAIQGSNWLHKATYQREIKGLVRGGAHQGSEYMLLLGQ